MAESLTNYPFTPAADALPPAGVPVLARTPHGTPVARWDGAAWRSGAWAAGTMPRAYVLAWMILPGGTTRERLAVAVADAAVALIDAGRDHGDTRAESEAFHAAVRAYRRATTETTR